MGVFYLCSKCNEPTDNTCDDLLCKICESINEQRGPTWLHILKLRILNKLGVPLTSNARGELARWITRDVKESIEETLQHIRGEINEEN